MSRVSMLAIAAMGSRISECSAANQLPLGAFKANLAAAGFFPRKIHTTFQVNENLQPESSQQLPLTGDHPAKISSGYVVFKSNSALKASFIPPSFRQLPSGTASLHEPGRMMIDMMERLGNNRFDWKSRITFYCSVDEMAGIASLSSSTKEVSFMHQSTLGSSKKYTKTFKVEKSSETVNTIFTVEELETRNSRQIMVPLTPAEMYVLTTLINYAIPRLMGLDDALIPTMLVDPAK